MDYQEVQEAPDPGGLAEETAAAVAAVKLTHSAARGPANGIIWAW